MRVLAGSRFQFGRAGIYFQHYNNRPPMDDLEHNVCLWRVELNAARYEMVFQDGRGMPQMIARSRKWLEEDFPLRDR